MGWALRKNVVFEQDSCPQRLKPYSGQCSYRSGKPLRHPNSKHVPISVGILEILRVWVVSARGQECPRYTTWAVAALLLRITPQWNPTSRKPRDVGHPGLHHSIPVEILRNLRVLAVLARGQECPRYMGVALRKNVVFEQDSRPQRPKPYSGQCSYRSGNPPRHPNSNTSLSLLGLGNLEILDGVGTRTGVSAPHDLGRGSLTASNYAAVESHSSQSAR